MDPILLVGLILAVIIVLAAAVAFLLYKADFRVRKLTAKLPFLEMEASRKESQAEVAPPSGRPKVRVKAQQGGKITKSGISAPAHSSVDVNQTSEGDGSEISDSPIKLT